MNEPLIQAFFLLAYAMLVVCVCWFEDTGK